MQLWPHQEAAQAFIRENPWCTINHFCGTGKTPIGLETIKRYTIAGTWNLSVVVVPRLSLIHQWHQKLREMEYDGEFLSINSDDDIRDTCASIEFTTDVEEIKRKLLIAKRASTNMCITITYKSLHLLEATLNDASIQKRPDLVLLDEAHHITEKDVCAKLFDKNDSTVATIYTSDSDTSSESESVSSDKSVNELKWKPFWVDIERMVFFTATPMNREGVVMDPELTDNLGQISIDEETLNEWKDEGLVPPLAEPKHVRPAFAGNSHCGPIHRYNHTEAVKDDRCNEFRIAIDLFPKHPASEETLNATEQTRYELFCSISRAVLSTGNARVLTFHKQVKDSEETMCSVSAMATDDAKVLFCKAFRTVLNEEFEHKRGLYTDIERCINILTIDAKNSPEERTRILNTLDNSPDTDDTKHNNRVTIVASCETIGEGIDTKRCNMVVFVDVIRSFVKIIQRIGRATRRPPTSEPLPPATILLPVGIDVSNYADVQGDPDKRDECIRASMLSENQGDFGLMLNTFAAVRQTDPQLYSICLFYPGRFAPSEVKKNLVRHGFAVVEPDLNASDQARLDEEEDFYDEERVSLCTALAHGETSSVSAYEEPLMDTLLEADDSNDAIQHYTNRTGRTVEIHSTSMETPVRRIEPTTNPAEGSNANDKVLYYDETKNVYRPTQRVSQADDDDTPVSNTGTREGPPPRKRMVNVHTHPEVKVLWSLTGMNENDSLDMLTRHTQLGYIEATVDMKGAVTQWFDMLAALEAWMAAHEGIRPKQKADDPTEKRLSNWIGTQQKNAKPPRKYIHATNDAVHNAWNEHVARHKAFYRTNEEEWFDTLAALEAWMATHSGKRPNERSEDPTEKRLGQWMRHQQQNAKPPRKNIHATSDAVHNAWNAHVLAHALTKSKKVVYSKKVVDAARAATQALTERIDAILAPYSLRSHDVGAAGDCQFRALADLLLDDAGRHAEVRAAVVAELTTHPERYREFMEEWDNRAVDTHQESYASYLERMAKSGTWGGNTTLLAAATVYGRRLMVVSAPVQEGSSYCTDVQPLLRETDLVATAETNDDALPIWLAYMNGNHYRATRPLDNETGVTPSIPPSTKQEDVKDRIQRFKQASNDTPTSKPKPKTKKRKAKPKTKDPKPAANHKPPAHKGQTSTDSALSTKKQKVTTVEAPPPPSAPEPIDTTLTAQSLSTGPDTVSPKRAASDMAGSEEATDPTVRARRRRTSSSQAREQRRHAQEDAMRKFQNKEQLTDSEHQLIQQILSNNNSRTSPDDSYSDDHHNNVDHVNWKQSMNDTFVDLLKRYAPTGGNVIYMDGPSGLTTHTLRRAGVGWTTHVANDCESNAGQLSQLVDRYEMDDVREAMRTTWADVPFVGAYLDTCAGKAETVEDMLQTLVTRTRYGSEHDAPIVLGYTITPRDPSGQNLYERVQRLQKFVNNLCKSQGYREVNDDEQFDECPNICTNFTHNSVVTHFVVLHRM